MRDMDNPRVRFQHLLFLASFLAAAAGCGPPMRAPFEDASIPPEADLARGAPPDLARPADLATVCGPCAQPTPVCDAANRKCVACLYDADCPDQFICTNKACVPGCSAGHNNCGDAGSCDVDMKLCHGCLADKDCRDQNAPFCDVVSGRCGACNPQNDRCPVGSYCGMANGMPACVSGCKNDGECQFADGGVGSSACCAHNCVDTRTSAANCGACGNDCKGGACCGATCIDTATDVRNCGACGKVCPSMNNVPTCVNGACGSAGCKMGYADCNMNPNDGCEIATGSDNSNCGACGTVCNLPNAQNICIGGVCQIGGCAMGFRNCNGLPNDGCETNTGTDPKNCGQCGQNCSQLPNATAGCMNGGCVVGSCSPGFGNCNKIDNDGCEAPLSADPLNCGSCGKVCPSPPNVVITCTNQVCGMNGCTPGFSDCNQFDLSVDGAMFGWRWRLDTNPKVLEVTAYANNASTHLTPQKPLTTLDADDLMSRTPLHYRVWIDGANYGFSIDGTIRGRPINVQTTLTRKCATMTPAQLLFQWASGFYFGGTSTSPSTITGRVSEIPYK